MSIWSIESKKKFKKKLLMLKICYVTNLRKSMIRSELVVRQVYWTHLSNGIS